VTMASANYSDRSSNSTGSTRTEFLVGMGMRTLRMADGPGEIYTKSIAKNEIEKWAPPIASHAAVIAESPRCT
jgi:hypothetical protein